MPNFIEYSWVLGPGELHCNVENKEEHEREPSFEARASAEGVGNVVVHVQQAHDGASTHREAPVVEQSEP